ncbi:MAG TPA: EamA family transporter, partial [Sulfurospirillum arcachonense]|nr:EamA family transporter [Sulfurospirillum arcachonense]
MSFATLFLILVILYKNYSFPKDKKTWYILIVAGILNNAVPFFLISWGQQYPYIC